MAQGQFALSEAQPVAPIGKYSLADAQPEEKPGAVSRFLDPLNPMHLVHALFKPSDNPKEDPRATFGRNVIGMVKDLGMAQVEQGKAALESWKKGNHADAVAQGLAALTPILGPMSQQAAEKFNSGDIAGGMGTLTSMALPEILHEAPGVIEATGDVVKAGVKAVTAPGVAQIVGGGAESVAGAAMTPAHPIAGPSLVVGGAARIKKGLEAFQAGKAARLAEEQAARGRELAAQHRAAPQRVPAWQVQPEAQPPAAAPAPVEVPAALPSGRTPGGIQNMRTAGQPTPEMLRQAGIPLTAEEEALAQQVMAGTEPQPPAAPAAIEAPPIPGTGNAAPIGAPGQPMQQPGISLPGGQAAAVPPEVPGLDAQRAFAEAMTGDPSGGAIPAAASPHPPAEAFEGAYRAKRAQVLADHFHEHGLSYQDVADLKPGDLAPDQWEALLGKDPQTGSQFRAPSQATIDQARVFLAHKYAAARNPAAMAAATELAQPAMEAPAPAKAPLEVVPKRKPRAKPVKMGDLMKEN